MQRVLVTAGAAGIGASISRAFASTGARVAICDIDIEAINHFCSDHPNILAAPADVGDEHSVADTLRWAIAALGGIDVLVNNAGIPGATSALETVALDDWRRCLDVNLTGPFLFIRGLAPHLKQQRSGCIINISTVSTRHAIPNRSAYVASKAGLEGLTRAAARELGPFNVRCNAVLPGFVDSRRGDEIIARLAASRGTTADQIERDVLQFISLRKKVTSADVAAMCVFLASDAASSVTGQLIAVDGHVEWEG